MEFSTSYPDLQNLIIERCYANGLLVYPSVGGPEGIDVNGILIAPPFIITAREVGKMMEIMEASFSQVSEKL